MPTFSINAGHISRPRVVGAGQIVNVNPAAGATAIVEYTTGTGVDVANNAATWRIWPKGAVTASASDQMNNGGYIRVTAVGGNVSYDIDEQPSTANASGYRMDWQSAVSATGAPILSGQPIVGGVINAKMPPGVLATLQFTKTLKAAPYTKSNIAGAVANAVNTLNYTVLQADTPYAIGCDASAQVSPALGMEIVDNTGGVVTPTSPVITAVTGFNNRVMVNLIAPATGTASQYRLTSSNGQITTVAANGLPYQAVSIGSQPNGVAVTIQAEAINSVGAASPLSSASASVTPVASRQISAAGNTFIPDAKHASNTQSMNVTFYTAARDLTTLGVEFPGWYVTGRAEANNTGTETWEADVTYNGNVTRITFGGLNSGTVAPGANLKSDEVTLGFTIPAGAEFSIGNYCTTTGQITFFSWYAADGKARQQYGTTGVPNLVGVLDKSALPLATSTPSAGAFVRTPSAIFSTADGPAVALSIDSNSVGRGDTGDNTHAQGHLGRALRAANVPYMHVGVSGDQLSGSGNGWLASSTKRIALAKRYSTHALAEPAINDLSSGRTAVQTIADRLTFKNLWGSTYPIAFTTLPSITTGDWTTIAGQTPNAISSEIQAYNTSTLAGVAGAIAIFDVNLMTSAPGDRTRWNVGAGGIAYTVEGTHYNQAGSLFVAPQIAAQISMMVG